VARTAVLALGGNALTREHERGTFDEQYANALAMATAVRSLIRRGWRIVIVHGNGPQVGNLAIQHAHAAMLVPAMPLNSLGAMTQGALGSLICLALHEACGDEIKGAVAVVTHIEVDPADPAFAKPTKPIGPFFTEAESERLTRTERWTMTEDSGRGYRRIVPSPAPLDALEAGPITALIDAGYVVVAVGGGGIPVVRDGSAMRGVEAVIDKDFAAERLAEAADATVLVMVTGVPNVKLDFGKPQERNVFRLNADEATDYLAAGQFPPGSMGPKMRAAIQFVNSGTPDSGRFAAITTPELVCVTIESLGALVGGHRGTRIESARDLPRVLNEGHSNVA
jgi:carbamate kinase